MRLLIADDHELTRRGIRSLIESRGAAHVAEAGNGAEAVAIASQGQFDLIILDISMPLCDGFAAAREIRKNDRTTPILFISLARTELFVGVARKIGANGYVTKSDPSSRLLEAIDSLLDKRDFFPLESQPGKIS